MTSFNFLSTSLKQAAKKMKPLYQNLQIDKENKYRYSYKFFEATKYIEFCSDDTGGVPISCLWWTSNGNWNRPLKFI